MVAVSSIRANVPSRDTNKSPPSASGPAMPLPASRSGSKLLMTRRPGVTPRRRAAPNDGLDLPVCCAALHRQRHWVCSRCCARRARPRGRRSARSRYDGGAQKEDLAVFHPINTKASGKLVLFFIEHSTRIVRYPGCPPIRQAHIEQGRLLYAGHGSWLEKHRSSERTDSGRGDVFSDTNHKI